MRLLDIRQRKPEVWRGPAWSPEQERANREWETFWRFFKYLYPHKTKVILGMLFIMVGVPLREISVFVNRYLVDDVILNFDLPVDRRLQLLFIVFGIKFLMYVISNVSQITRRILGWYIDMKVTIHLRTVFYDHLHKLSLGFLQSRPIGEHMYRSTADVGGGLITMITDDVPNAITIAYRIIWTGIILSLVDPWLTVLIFLYSFPYTALSHYFYTRLQRVRWDMRMQAQYLRTILRDGIAATKTVKGFGRMRWSARRYASTFIENRRYWIKYRVLHIFTHQGVLWFLSEGVEKLLWLYVGYHTMTGELSIGEFSVVFFLARQFEGPMERMIKLIQSIRLQLVQAERVLQTLDVRPQISDAPDASTMPPLSGTIEFRNVGFEYVSGQPVLENINITIRPGERVAFVGPSGSGKTSMLYLILRLYDPTTGSVLVDGRDLKDVRLLSYRNQLGVVLQDTFLFSGTVRENIRYGNLKASDADVEEAARRAALYDAVIAHPEGFERDLGEGTRLSGGQKQRIGIARALIRDPAVFILDEATSNLDSRSEEHVMDTIWNVSEGRTTVMVSHRLMTVQKADRIYVLDQGRIVENGTHDDLLSANGLYRRIWDEQMQLGTDVDAAD